MSSQKNRIVEKINKSTKMTHHLWMSIKRSEKDRKNNPNGRRKRSTFSEDFAVRTILVGLSFLIVLTLISKQRI